MEDIPERAAFLICAERPDLAAFSPLDRDRWSAGDQRVPDLHPARAARGHQPAATAADVRGEHGRLRSRPRSAAEARQGGLQRDPACGAGAVKIRILKNAKFRPWFTICRRWGHQWDATST